MSKYLFYQNERIAEYNIPEEFGKKYLIHYVKVHPFSRCGKGRIANVYWTLISRYVWICEITERETGIVRHYSYMMKKSYKFPFMTKHMYQLGPSFTEEHSRGEGLFTTAIRFIEHIVIQIDPDAIFIGVVREDNIPSRKGMEKCGIVSTGRSFKKNRLKIYTLDN